MAQIKLISMTVGLTVLIWVFADQLLRESDELLVHVRLASAGPPGMSVRTPDDHPPSFRVRVSGPRRIIAKKLVGGSVGVDLPVTERKTGRYTLNMPEELRKLQGPFDGLSIESVNPENLEILVDNTVTVEMEVRLRETDAFDFEIDPTVEPTLVRVTISELALYGLPPDIPGIPPDQRFVALNVNRHLAKSPPGTLFSRDVMLEHRVAGVNVRIEPPEVRLVAQLTQHRKEATIPAVPINFQGSATVLNRYFIDQRDPFTLLTQPITLRGPDDVLDQITSGQIKLFGIITLTTPNADEVGKFQQAVPHFNLPSGVELVGSPDPVEFRLMLRPSPDNGIDSPQASLE
ncbi:MAG: hypothetical protein JXB13_02545 [Phycisphaerae bacterium]|nr:hypothetical protein [Phycisphaerae bacterium]